jgi:Domain of unknown function (DUF4821)
MHEQSDVLRDTFGDFFLADMIDAQDDQNRCAHCSTIAVLHFELVCHCACCTACLISLVRWHYMRTRPTLMTSVFELYYDERRALAALVERRACGLMAASSDLDLAMLQQCFELQQYDQLVKVTAAS